MLAMFQRQATLFEVISAWHVHKTSTTYDAFENDFRLNGFGDVKKYIEKSKTMNQGLKSFVAMMARTIYDNNIICRGKIIALVVRHDLKLTGAISQSKLIEMCSETLIWLKTPKILSVEPWVMDLETSSIDFMYGAALNSIQNPDKAWSIAIDAAETLEAHNLFELVASDKERYVGHFTTDTLFSTCCRLRGLVKLKKLYL